MKIELSAERLRDAYDSATKNNGLIELCKKIRQGGSFKRQEVGNILDGLSEDWEKIPKASGHKEYKNSITGIVIGFQNHSSGKDSVVSPRILNTLLDQIQLHLNILCNVIFDYRSNNWKNPPVYPQALSNLSFFKKNRKSIMDSEVKNLQQNVNTP